MTTPNHRELQLVMDYAREQRLIEGRVKLAQCIASYREELLKPFAELVLDLRALGDEKMARALDDLITTARGAK